MHQVPSAELTAHHITAFQTGWRLKLKQKVLTFLSDESGATAIEYGLIAAGISLAIIAIVNSLGTNISDKFTSINTSLK
jgi:pilus assembly protein Flp/PilA